MAGGPSALADSVLQRWSPWDEHVERLALTEYRDSGLARARPGWAAEVRWAGAAEPFFVVFENMCKSIRAVRSLRLSEKDVC